MIQIYWTLCFTFGVISFPISEFQSESEIKTLAKHILGKRLTLHVSSSCIYNRNITSIYLITYQIIHTGCILLQLQPHLACLPSWTQLFSGVFALSRGLHSASRRLELGNVLKTAKIHNMRQSEVKCDATVTTTIAIIITSPSSDFVSDLQIIQQAHYPLFQLLMIIR